MPLEALHLFIDAHLALVRAEIIFSTRLATVGMIAHTVADRAYLAARRLMKSSRVNVTLVEITGSVGNGCWFEPHDSVAIVHTDLLEDLLVQRLKQLPVNLSFLPQTCIFDAVYCLRII